MKQGLLSFLMLLAAGFPVIGLAVFSPASAWAAPGKGSEGTQDEIDDDIEDDIENDIEDALEGDIEDDIEDDVEGDIEDDIEDDVESDIEDDIEDDIESDVEANIESDIEDAVEGDVEDAVEDAIESDVEAGVEDDIESDVENDVEDDIESDIEDNVEDSVESRIEDGVADRIDDRIEKNSGPGKARERDIEDEIEAEIESSLDDRSGSQSGDDKIADRIADKTENLGGKSAGDNLDAERDLAKAAFKAAKTAAETEMKAARAAAEASRDAALALPGADEDAVKAQYKAAVEAAESGRKTSQEQATSTYNATLSAIKSAEEGEAGANKGSSHARRNDDDDDGESSGPGGGDDDDDDGDDGDDGDDDDGDSSGPGGGNDDDGDNGDEDEGAGSSGSNAGRGNADDDDDDDDNDDDDDSNSGGRQNKAGSETGGASSNAIFELGYDAGGNEIERGELLVLAPAAALDALAEKGFRTRQVEALDGLDFVLAQVDASDRGIVETEAAIRDAAPEAEIDYNHVYHRHDDKAADGNRRRKTERDDRYRPEIKKSRDARYGQAPDELFRLPVANGGAGVTVGIIDTRVDKQHAALANAQLAQQDFVPFAHEQPSEHGTSVASILAGESGDYNGLLPRANVYAASVFFNSPTTGSESATTTSLVRALDWMTENKVAVVNMSLTGPPNAILKSAIDRAYEKGTIVVAAVGNEGPSSPPLYPAAYDNVVAVTAVNKSNRIYRLANRGDYVDFAAPGVNVRHADGHGNFASSSGTSMAAPFVTAVLAASEDGDGRITAEELSALAANAIDLGRKGFDPVYGNGLIRPLSD